MVELSQLCIHTLTLTFIHMYAYTHTSIINIEINKTS